MRETPFSLMQKFALCLLWAFLMWVSIAGSDALFNTVQSDFERSVQAIDECMALERFTQQECVLIVTGNQP